MAVVGGDISIEPAKPNDRDSIIATSDLTFQEHAQRQPDVFAAKDSHGVGKLLDAHFALIAKDSSQNVSHVLVCRSKDAVVGHLILTCRNEARGSDLHDREAFVQDLSLRPEFRGRGIGTKLLAQAEEWAGRNGATLMGGVVWDGNDASDHMFLRSEFKSMATTYRKRLAPPLVQPMPKIAQKRNWWRVLRGDLATLIVPLGTLLLVIVLDWMNG